MKKLILILSIILSSAFSHSQIKTSDFSIFGGPSINAHFIGAEFGGMVGVNWRNTVYASAFTELDLHYISFSGLFLKYTINPKGRNFRFGLSTKIGIYDASYMYIDLLGFETDWIINDHISLGPRVSIRNGYPAVDFKILFGNFKVKND